MTVEDPVSAIREKSYLAHISCGKAAYRCRAAAISLTEGAYLSRLFYFPKSVFV